MTTNPPKMSGISRLALMLMATVFPMISALAQVQTLYDTPGTPTWRDNYTGGSGCLFTVGPTNVVVSHLGFFQSNAISSASVIAGGGLNTNHYVGIYSHTTPPQLLAQVIVPAGTSADYFTNQFCWMPLDPPFLLISNTSYYVAAMPYNGDGDLWGDSFSATFNPYFVGTGVTTVETAYGPGNNTWPIPGFSLFGSNTTYCCEGLGNLAVDQARVGVQVTNLAVLTGGTISVFGYASGAQPINYQWYQPGNPPSAVPNQTNSTLTIANAAPGNSGTYYLTASNSLGGEQSANVQVVVSSSPVGVQQDLPTSVTNFANYPLTLSLVVTGSPPIALEWFSNSIALPGTIAYDAISLAFPSSYSLYTMYPANNGNQYDVVASNYVNSTYYATSSVATLTVLPNLAYPQEILHGPPPTNVFNSNGGLGNSGNNQNGGSIVIGSQPVLVTHLGYDAVGMILNNQATVQTNHNISLYNSAGVLLGYTTVTNGTPTNNAIDGYLWAPLNPPLVLPANSTNILAAQTYQANSTTAIDPWGDTYGVADWNPYFTPGGPANTALYGNTWPTVPASGGYGSQMYSAPNMAILTNFTAVYVSNTPATSPNYSSYVSTLTNTVGTGLALIGYAEGQPPLYYPQWYLNGAPLANQTNTSLIIPSLTPASGGNYYLVVSNYQTSLTVTSTVTAVIVVTNPLILAQYPVTYTNILNTNLMTLYAGADPVLSLSVIGGTPFRYQWFTNGAAVSGATNASYTQTNVQATGATNFYCIITNVYGSATSAVWSASVIPDPPNGAALAPYPQAVLALGPIGYWRLNDTNLDGVDNGAGDDGYLCHDYAGGNDGIYTNVTLGQPGYNPDSDPSDTSVQVGFLNFTDCDANSIAGINFGSPAGTSKAFSVEAWVNGYSQASDAGIVTLGYGGGGEQFDLDTGSDPGHNFRFFIRDAAGNTHLVNSSVQPEFGTWYHVVGVVDEISSQTVTLYINGTNAGTATVTNGSGVLASSLQMSIGSRMSAQGTTLNDQFVGDINDVAIYNYALSANQVLNQYLVGGQVAPYCTATSAPPASVTVVAGAPLVIPATAYGSPVMGYQWVNENTSAVLASGTGSANTVALNSGYSLGSAPEGLNGQTLQLNLTNAYGMTSFDVSVTVTEAPEIVTDLPPQVVIGQGQTYAYSIGAVGVTPLGYQWYENNSGVAGATNDTFEPPSNAASTNSVYVVVTNAYGMATSSTSTFEVVALPNTPLASAIMALNPVAYWPMHEVEPAAPGDIEVNNGTLGALGNAYYPDWPGDNSTAAFQRGYQSAIASDGDPSLFFTAGNSTTTNALYIPHTSPATTLYPPFTVELWLYPTGSQNDIWSQDGYEGLNAGSIGGGGGSVCGIRLYGGNGGLTVYSYYNSSSLNGPLSLSTGMPNNQWYHVVVTCDVHTNISMYTNGVQALTTTSYAGLYSPDYWTPFELANGRGDSRATKCALDEVAIYTNVLSTTKIVNHYQTGINPSPATSYYDTVSNDMPVIYLRMDAPSYSPPPVSTWPALYNYGSAVGNGVYTPGTLPGAVPGPNTTYTAVNQATNVAPLSGVSSFADAGYSPVLDPSAPNGTGSNAFSVVCSFRGNPADNRFQDLVGHSDSSWRMTLGANDAGGGAAGSVQFTYGSTASSTISCNDGKWHQAVGVYQPGYAPNEPGSVRLYVDGVLNALTGTVSTNGIVSGAPHYDVLLGAAPDYTNQDIQNVGSPYSLGRQFAGELCDVAVFTNALTAAQVQALYNAAGGVQQTLAMPYSGQLPVTWNRVGANLGNNLGPTNLLTVYAGASPSFMVTVSGAPVYYQWYTNNVGVGFGTNAILTLPNVQSSFTTYCIATDSINSVTSVVWSASVVADPDAAGSFSQTVLSDNPVAYWRLNEAAGSTIAIDYAGGANGEYGSQTTNGLPGVPVVAANNELSVAMDPTASTEANGTVTNNGIILFTNQATFLCWVYPTSSSGPNPAGLFQNRSTAGSSGFQLNESGSPEFLDYNWSGSSSAYGYGDPYGFPLNRWGMAVCEITPQNAQFYLYGTNGLIGIATNNFNSQIESFFGGNEIGADPNGGVTRILYGRMNELAIFNYQLSPAQLAALYQAATNGALTAPYFVTQPQNATVVVGTTTNFSAAANTFVQPVTNQWYYNTTPSYSGAVALVNGVQANGSWATNVATSQLTITNVTFGAAGYYFEAAANSIGAMNSAIVSLTVTPVTTPTNIVASFVGQTNLVLTWPANRTGWRLLAQTDTLSAGLNPNSNDWVTVSGSTSTNQVVLPVNPTNGCVFYKLVYP